MSLSVDFIATTLEKRIRSGDYRGGHWLPTERVLSEEFKVSRATLRLALVELERRNLVLRSVGSRPIVRTDLNAKPIPVETSTQRRCLGLWIAGEPTDIGATLTTRGVQGALDHDAFRLAVSNPLGDSLEKVFQEEAQVLARMARDPDIAGVLLWYLGGEHNLPALKALRAANVPMVFLDRRPPAGFEADAVGVDNRRASEEMVEHLVAQRHRNIAYITNANSASTVKERLAGYIAGLKKAGIPFRPELVLTSPYIPSEEDEPNLSAAAVADQLLELPELPTAVFVVNDHSALLLVAELRSRGVRIPEDIAVAGFDNSERWTPGRSFLTTVRQPFERMGAEAVRLLCERIEEGTTGAYRHILLDAALVVRESTHRKKC